MHPVPGNLPSLTPRSSLWGAQPQAAPCRLVVRKENEMTEILQFVSAGMEIGQQVIALAGPGYLRDLACGLNDKGLRPDASLHNGRLVFLTAPNCLFQLTGPFDSIRRGHLRTNGSVVRWVSDWSWAYANGTDQGAVLDCQRRIHDFARSLNALSLCSVHCEKPARGSLLAMLADHRRAARVSSRPS